MTRPDSPVFPIAHADDPVLNRPGITLRQYAAIHLRVPNSGEEWLDEMIVEAKRIELAKQAMQSHLWRDKWKNPFTDADLRCLVGESYAAADAMLVERAKKEAGQ